MPRNTETFAIPMARTYFPRLHPLCRGCRGRSRDQKEQRKTKSWIEIERKSKSGYTQAADVACLRGLRTLVEGTLDATIRCEVLRLVSA